MIFYNNNHKSAEQQQQRLLSHWSEQGYFRNPGSMAVLNTFICHLLKSLYHEDIRFFSSFTVPQNSPEEI